MLIALLGSRYLASLLGGGVGCLVLLVPLLRHLLLPVVVLLDLIDSILDDGQSLSDLIVLHVLFVVQVVCELNQLINLFFFLIFELFLAHGPSRLALALLG